MIEKKKYPRTYHLDFSKQIHSDDKIIKTLDFFNNKEIIITEKLDGENTTLYTHSFHARSLDSQHNFTRNWIKQLHSYIGYKIPDGWRLCGENVNYLHSIAYENLDSYFYLFSIWNEKNERLHWDEMMMFAEDLDLATPHVFYRGAYDLDMIKDLAKNFDTENKEGFVVSTVDGFHYDDFTKYVTKWVRENHVQPNQDGVVEHWLKNTKPNLLKDPLSARPIHYEKKKLNLG